jgi:hypothetical protein
MTPFHPLILHDTPPTGLNKRRMVQRAVMEELVKLVDSGTKPYQMKKGAYSLMIAGLIGCCLVGRSGPCRITHTHTHTYTHTHKHTI